MKERIAEFIIENNLSSFNQYKTPINLIKNSVYKTRDAKSVHNKVISKISQHFVFADTSNIFSMFNFTQDKEEIKSRQEFFKKVQTIGKQDNSFLKELRFPKKIWKPKYDIVVVTENSDTFSKLKEMNCPVQLLVSENDLIMLENRDLVQVIDCDEYGLALESLPQAVFLKNLEEVYLERHLEELSGWKNNLEILNKNKLSSSLNQLIEQLFPLLSLIDEKQSKVLTKDYVEKKVEEINNNISERIKFLNFSGNSLLTVLSKKVLPEELKQIVREEISKSDIPSTVLIEELPVKIFDEELEKTISRQNSNEYYDLAEEVKRKANELKEIPKKLRELNTALLIFDFVTGISQFIESEMQFTENSENLQIINSKNIFLEKPQAISFELDDYNRCSILTGANSGGKTTLIEHVIQLISLSQLGIPVYGKVSIPLFTDVYYFAKNKGSTNKGAFETLLTQMSQINPGNKTLILADEIEAATEPGVAGSIISSTAEYYLNQNCFLIIATHLGNEIQKILPEYARIDGIEAKGLTKEFDLIVDHNPVLGRLANSTPELIVERMANTNDNNYFKHLNNKLKNKYN